MRDALVVANAPWRWALDGEPLDLAGRTSVSNGTDGGRGEIRAEGGIVLVFLPGFPPGC